ncbi:hypothetical protein [Pseudalkalibacillus salsuginis]|uniref:hypothetical protein n=1 Tax=Pseudalkalibacillus salsuginis TaxID=2910972 RepID=UPI001F234DFF|nr:hypothetical protein [Pseudalkalibacillus salsuginis]MCF6410698.1 hypothetical protein [Pseudalkalibacillus salsuginis]
MNDAVFWVTSIGGLLSLGVFVWYYASLGKRISKEEKEAGKDLTYKINSFTGTSKNTKQNK